jgi:dimethylargininase
MISVPVSRRLAAAVLAGAATAVAAHLATLFIFFVGNGFDPSVLGVANGFFGFSSLFVFVLVAAGAYVTELARWYLALLVGVVAAFAGAFIGTLLGAAASGTPVSGDLASGVLASLGGVNLSFEVSTVLAALLLAPRVYDAWLSAPPARVRSGKLALVRLPGSALGRGATSVAEQPADAASEGVSGAATMPASGLVDVDRADEQWAAYVDVLREAGWSIVEIPLADDQPDSVFVEDALVVIGDLAILTRHSSELRRAELDDVEAGVRRLGLSVARIAEPGSLDGGDVLQVADTVYVGVGGGTDADGVRQLRELLRPTGRRVVAVPLGSAAARGEAAPQLKHVVTALPDGTVLGAPLSGVDARLFRSYLEVPEPEGAQVAVLGEDTILMAESATGSAELVRSLGYRVLTADVSEFAKLRSGVSRLSVRIG